ncbi:hypothetical protein D3C73_1464810 [compost metagenome]
MGLDIALHPIGNEHILRQGHPLLNRAVNIQAYIAQQAVAKLRCPALSPVVLYNQLLPQKDDRLMGVLQLKV